MLWLHFEDLQQDLEGCVREIAAFMPGVNEHDEELIAIAVKQGHMEFMKQVCWKGSTIDSSHTTDSHNSTQPSMMNIP